MKIIVRRVIVRERERASFKEEDFTGMKRKNSNFIPKRGNGR